MKCCSKAVIRRKIKLYDEDRQQRRQEYLDSLSEDERTIFLEKERAEHKRKMDERAKALDGKSVK